MASAVSVLLVLLAGLLLIPVIVLCVEIVAAITAGRNITIEIGNERVRCRVAVLVPAHNEGTGLLHTLQDIQGQLQTGNRLLVVADNCTDDTASLARAAGAEVVERNDRSHIGKGYALDFGIRHLAKNPPDLVVMIDADCRLGYQALNRLVTTCAASGRPTQGCYLLTGPVDSPIDHRAAEFAFRVKNLMRPLGCLALNWPCQLMGSCMAFPWKAIRSLDLHTGHIVEDLNMGIDLAQVGYPPLFCPSATASSDFPSSARATNTQRKRWEQGHLGMIVTKVPKLLYNGIIRRDYPLLAITLDLTVPPLVLLGTLLSLIFVLSATLALLGQSSVPLLLSSASILIFVGTIVLAWRSFGSDILPAQAILSQLSYVVKKFPLYGHMLARPRNAEWIRTGRHKSDEEN